MTQFELKWKERDFLFSEKKIILKNKWLGKNKDKYSSMNYCYPDDNT